MNYDILQPIPQGVDGAYDEENQRIQKIADELSRRGIKMARRTVAKYRLQMNNTVGIIDSDYYGADNEGHIFCKLTNDSRQDRTVLIRKGDGMVQGIFVPFGITEDDDAAGIRTGGFGSTTESEQKK